MNGLHILGRRAVLERLKSHPAVLALVPASSIYGQTTQPDPAWPFINLGPTNTVRRSAACLWGGDVTMLVSAFAKPRRSGAGSTIETAEDHAGRIGAAIESALARYGTAAVFDGAPARVRCSLGDMRLAIDGAEMDAFHYSATVTVRISAE